MLIPLALLFGACQDPPRPAPLPSPDGSTAPWVEWRRADDPVRGPVVRVVDLPGGPVDRLLADADVSTFLNDRFHPLFRSAHASQPMGTLVFLDGCGCALTPPLVPPDAPTLIALANGVVVRTDATRCEGRPFEESCVHTRAIHGAD